MVLRTLRRECSLVGKVTLSTRFSPLQSGPTDLAGETCEAVDLDILLTQIGKERSHRDLRCVNLHSRGAVTLPIQLSLSSHAAAIELSIQPLEGHRFRIHQDTGCNFLKEKIVPLNQIRARFPQE